MKTANTAKIVPVVADNTAWTFTATTATLNGHEFAAEYSLAQSGDVYVFAIVQGIPVRIHVGKASPVYHACFEAAMAAKSQPKAEAKPAEQPKAEAKPAAEPAKPVETKPAEQPKAEAKPAAKRKAPAKAAKQPAAEKPAAEPAKPVETKPADQPKAETKPATKRKAPAKAAKQPATEKPAAEPAKPVETKPADQPKAEAKPAAEPAKPVDVASKSWIGTTVEGKGWRIAFDEATQRTRVIFDADPSAKQKAAIDAAGFYWSNTTKSWNKKLTCKAYRAAMALHETLNALA